MSAYHVEQHFIADDLAECSGELACMALLDAQVLAGAESLLAKYAGFDDYLREQGATS